MQPVAVERAASLRKRLLAAGIDAVPFVITAVLSVSIRRQSRSRRRDLAWDLVLRILEGSYRILATSVFGQTFGQRAVGIRVVDANTGQPPALRQAAVRWAVTSAPDAVLRLIPAAERAEQTASAMRELQPSVERLKREHSGDRVALNQALMALYREHHINPSAGCWPSVVLATMSSLYSLIVNGAAARGPLHQGLHDRVAKTVVIEEA